MKKVLVAGSTGYLGQFVVKELKKRGYWVRALVRNKSKLKTTDNEIDEIVIGEVTKPNTLNGICDDIDIVFSSVGITKQKDKLTFKDVDYQGNKNLLEVALKANIEKFIYVSVFNGPNLVHLDIVKAHEDFVDELKRSGINFSVIRPTGYFSDMEEYLKMAKRGRVYLFGKGMNKMNPIHGADLAISCADAIESGRQEIDIGGPEILSGKEIGRIALETYQKPIKISSVPVWLTTILVSILKKFNKHEGGLLDFTTTICMIDLVAPSSGTILLKDYFNQRLTECS